ncbi:MAG: putative metal-binding motif-containing protein [Myxococcota bacterium]
MTMNRGLGWGAILLLVAACGDDSPATDAALDGDAVADQCATAAECDDGRFCNGEETCDPSAATADSRGCLPGMSPCLDGATCDEAMQSCSADCANPDADGDGADSEACGGLDCDDSDRNRFPGNEEICDAANRDEDCDPNTFGFRDADGDGSPDALCCNERGPGDLVCGDDCDDMRPGTNPDNPEVCNGRDDDCDELVDEEVLVTLTRDADGDLFGDRTAGAMTMEGCGPMAGWVVDATDCNDMDASIRPGATELCNNVDEDCNGVVDDVPGGCQCTAGDTTACSNNVGACTVGVRTCQPGGVFGACNGTEPTSETCNNVDDDCDGMTDESLRINCYPDVDNDGFAPAGASATLTCPSLDAARAVAPFNGCPPTSTGTAPTTNRFDCRDDMTSVSLPTPCYTDSDGDGYGRGSPTYSCGSCGSGRANRAGDCCDTDASSRPGAACGGRNNCGSFDRNCSGSATKCASVATGMCGVGASCICTGGSCTGWLTSVPACGSSSGSYIDGCGDDEGFCVPRFRTGPAVRCR